MEIPYTVSTRPDTGLWNAKIGIWLFLASEVMLFGGLFSAYIFLRLDAQPGDVAARSAQRSRRHDEHRDPDRVVGHGRAGVGLAEDATVQRLLVVHARHHPVRHHLSWSSNLLTNGRRSFDHFGVFIKPEALRKVRAVSRQHRRAEKGLRTADRDHRSPAQSRGAARSER